MRESGRGGSVWSVGAVVIFGRLGIGRVVRGMRVDGRI